MSTTTSTTVTTGDRRATVEDHDTGQRVRHGSMAYFQRLLAQRRLFGQLAECQRSHKGEDSTTDMLDSIVNLLTDELEIRFPDDWAEREPDLLLTEAAMLHDPTDGPLVGCGICHEHQQAAGQTRHRTKKSAAPATGTRPVGTTVEVA